MDNIFPHHTNEIAQSEAYLGHQWCNYWFHVHHLVEKDKGKMSKSSGEFLTVSLLQEKGYDPLAYRFFCLQSHYRKPLEFSYEVLDQMSAAYQKLLKRVGELKEDGEVDEKAFAEYREKFLNALTDDINTSMAITVLYDVLKADMNDSTKRALVADFDKALSLDLLEGSKKQSEDTAVDSELENWILERIDARKAAKKNKDFALADQIRDELLAKGIVLEDTREGTKWKKA